MSLGHQSWTRVLDVSLRYVFVPLQIMSTYDAIKDMDLTLNASLDDLVDALAPAATGNSVFIRGFIDSLGTTLQSIHNGTAGVLLEPVPVGSTTGFIRISTSALDDVAGDGAQEIELTFVDKSGNFGSQLVATSGTSGLSFSSQAGTFVSSRVTQTGVLGTNAGLILVQDLVFGAPFRFFTYIAPGEGKGQGETFEVPAGFTLQLARITGGCSGPCILTLQEVTRIVAAAPDPVFKVHFKLPVDGSFDLDLSTHPVFVAGTILRVAGQAVVVGESLQYTMVGVLSAV